MKDPVLAIDIGGTKFAAAVATADGTLHDRFELPAGPRPHTTLHNLLERASVHDLAGVGIGSAGPIDLADGSVSPVNIPTWRDFHLVREVQRHLPGLPVTLAGDAQCMALGEWWRSGREMDSLLGIVVSTGIGGGIVLNGQPILGSTGNAGFLGHMVVDPGGASCACGATGCLETIASGPSMVRWALTRGWTSGKPDARSLAGAARTGDPIAQAAFTRAGEALASVIADAAILLDLRHTVIGGGVAAAGDLLLTPIRAALSRRHLTRSLTVTTTALDRDAGLHGAAALALTTTSLQRPRRR